MTDWENRYQADDMPWEKGQAAPPLQEVLAKVAVHEWGNGPVLVPGCGFGHDVRVLAELGLMVLGVDVSETAVARADAFPKVGAETYEVGNFLNPEWQAGRAFTGWWEHTCFCAIDPADRGAYAKAAAECLVDGGLLAGVFFINPYDPGEERSGPPHGVTVAEVEQWFSPWFQRVEGWVPTAAYPGREGREWIGLFRKSPQG
jgi:methyl halide transferase